MSGFSKLLSEKRIIEFLNEKNLKTPTEVQRQSIPDFLHGKSMNVLAQTGTGKTLAFALPLAQLIKENEDKHGISSEKGKPKALILAPTKELAVQIFSVFKDISHKLKIRVRLLVGGESSKKTKDLAKDSFEILVAGPGRALSAIKSREISVHETDYLIVDEADQLLDMGFIKDIEKIFGYFNREQTQVSLYSATMPSKFREELTNVFSGVTFKDITLQDTHKVQQNIETFNIYLDYREKTQMIKEFLKRESKGKGIIFTNQKKSAAELYSKISEDDSFSNIKFYLLHGDMTAAERKESISSFKSTGGILICTDIAARGIDIDYLKWVLNFDLPFEPVYYIHRCGRTGRGGKEGTVYNFVTAKDASLMKKINEAITNQSSLSISTLDIDKIISNQQNNGQKSSKDKKARSKVKRAKKTPGFIRRKK